MGETALLEKLIQSLEAGDYMGALTILIVLVATVLLKKRESLIEKIAGILDKEPVDHQKTIQDDIQVQHKLTEILNDFGADRAFLCEFHNGDYNIAHIPRMKMSVRSEATAMNVHPIANSIQSIPLMFYHDWVEVLMQGQMVGVVDIHAEGAGSLKERNGGRYQFLALHNVRSVYVVGLYTPKGELYGAGVIEYCMMEKEFSPEEMAGMKMAYNEVGETYFASK